MNEYSSTWFNTFLATVDPAQTHREVEFLKRQLPLDRFPRVLDLCCGLGRHSGPLTNVGYAVTGVERNASLVRIATSMHPHVQFIEMDARDIGSLNQRFDAVICMWQSFGFGSATENDEILARISFVLRAPGRFVLDIYNRIFFEPRQGTLMSTRNGREICETKSIHDDRLRVQLVYDNDPKSDQFEWEIFSVDQIAARAHTFALKLITSCTSFDEHSSVSNSSPRMQIVFEKLG